MRVLTAVVTICAIFCPTTLCAASSSSVSQYGITWTFDHAYPIGTFVNGDFWVVGPVKITSITPNASNGRNGWNVNPLPADKQPYDSRARYYQSSVMPMLPYTANPGSSLIKTISRSSPSPASCDYNYLQTAAVLTVVAAPPPDDGATVFRPPYVGPLKPYYSTSAIRWELLPSLDPVDNAPTIASIVTRLNRVQLDHINPDSVEGGIPNCEINPTDNMSSYGPEVANDNNEGVLRLTLNDSKAEKTPLAVALIQGGIDRYFAAKNGQIWPPGAGYEQGRKISIAFAAVMLNDAAMQQLVKTSDFFFEDASIERGNGGKALFGDTRSSPGESPEYNLYWDYQRKDPGYNLDYPDPYGFIDGGMNPERDINGYQYCCTSLSYKGSALAGRIIPELFQIWGRSEFFEYVDRYVTHGVITQPDPCAPLSQGGGPTPDGGCVLDPDLASGSTMKNFSCKAGKQCGRFPQNDGKYANEGGYGSVFTDAMWEAYRNKLPTAPLVPTRPTNLRVIR